MAKGLEHAWWESLRAGEAVHQCEQMPDRWVKNHGIIEQVWLEGSLKTIEPWSGLYWKES